MLIGYVRVSKSDGTQTLAPQRDALLAAGVDPARIYEDLASGRRDDRPGLAACLKAIQPGNTLVLWKLDRLGRDLRHLVNTVEDLRTRGVGLKVLAGAGAQIDTTTANGRLAFGIFAAFAEFERELIAERTMAGLAAARARGRMGGRPRKMDRATLMMAMSAMADRKAVAAEVAERLGLTTTTLYAYVNGDGTPKAAGQAVLDGTHRPATEAAATAAASARSSLSDNRRRVMPKGSAVPIEALSALRRRLAALPVRHPERGVLMTSTAGLYALADDAATLLAAKLKTPLQIGQHLVRAFEAGFEIGAKPIDAGVVEVVLSSQLDDLEPQLTRNGYDLRSLVEQFDAKPAEIRRLLRGDLDPGRTQELMDEMRAAGLPT